MSPTASASVRLLSVLLHGWREDVNGRGSAYQALAARLRLLVLDGRLAVGVRLPGERDLAVLAGTSRTTATAAYRVLREQGFAHGRHGSGTYTRLPQRMVAEDTAWPVPGHGPDVDLALAAPTAPPLLHQAFSCALEDLPAHLPDHGYHLGGLPDLRARIAARYGVRGLPTTPEQVLVTPGAAAGLHLVLRCLARHGDGVMVENPTWPLAMHALRAHGLRLVPWAVEDGWDTTALGAAMARRPSLAYLMTDFHNPTGALMPLGVRQRLVAALADAGTTVVVDETTAELDLREYLRPGVAREAPVSLAALARRGAVVLVGSASKAFWGGLRLGWVRAGTDLVRNLELERARTDQADPVVEQLALCHLLDSAEESLQHRRAGLSAGYRALTTALAAYLPLWHAPEPDGGMVTWCPLPAPVSSRLAQAASAHGLRLAPGHRFASSGAMERRVRLPFSLPAEQLDDAVRRLAAAYAALPPGSAAQDNALARVV